MASYREQKKRYQRRTKLEAKYHEMLRAKDNRIHELEQKLLEIEYPLLNQISKQKIDIEQMLVRVEKAEARSTHMLLWCPACGERHIDKTITHPHKNHACQHCGMVWAPSTMETLGVQFLPGYKDPT